MGGLANSFPEGGSQRGAWSHHNSTLAHVVARVRILRKLRSQVDQSVGPLLSCFQCRLQRSGLVACHPIFPTADCSPAMGGSRRTGRMKGKTMSEVRAAVLKQIPDRGFIAVLASGTAGGAMARGLLGAVIGAPLLVSLLVGAGTRSGLFGGDLALALQAVLVTSTLLAVLVRNVRRLDRMDGERRKQAEALLSNERGRLKTILDTVGDPIFVKDNDHRIILANRAFNEIFGLEEGAAIGKTLAEDVPEEERRHFLAIDRRVLDTGIPDVREETLSVRGRATRTIVTRKTRFIESSGESFLVGSIHDITEPKRAEQALREANLRLNEADRRKSEFLALLSHELRNPLTPIRNSLYILERATPGGEQARRAHSVIARQVGHLTRLVDDLLDLTRISHGKVRLQRTPLDLVDLVRQTVEDHRAVLGERELVVELPPAAVWIDADPTRLIQVLGNLLGNAAKFTPRDGKVTVSLARTRGRVVLEVADTGIGIDPGTLPRLFEPFAQAAQSLDRSRGGLGLGLALVKGLVELHGGAVSVVSDGPGQGARFTITLPVDEQAPVAATSRPPRVGAGLRHRVLIIEDNVDAAESLREVVEMLGHEVAVAYDGPSGITRARTLRPEIVLCDIGLPGMDGYQVARTFREDAVLRSARLVALSGYAQPEDVRRATEAGFERHLAKPPSLAQVEQVLGALTSESVPPLLH